jgi:hypothetical protein
MWYQLVNLYLMLRLLYDVHVTDSNNDWAATQKRTILYRPRLLRYLHNHLTPSLTCFLSFFLSLSLSLHLFLNVIVAAYFSIPTVGAQFSSAWLCLCFLSICLSAFSHDFIFFLSIYRFSLSIFPLYLSFLSIYLFSLSIFSLYLSFLSIYLFSTSDFQFYFIKYIRQKGPETTMYTSELALQACCSAKNIYKFFVNFD